MRWPRSSTGRWILPDPEEDHFDDDSESVFEGDINSIAEAGISYGCNPPDNTWFCPNTDVLRQEMASFLVRGYDLEPVSSSDRFTEMTAVSMSPTSRRWQLQG
ncbi:MAG: hypothetical protein GEU79_16425 [Acidimicrobiia bacterium]|nr:hypothetical protein [Acidimicrobiia bacterium]